MPHTITANDLLNAYASGYFPMADSRSSSELFWYSPEERGILPLDTFHIPHSLRKFINKFSYEIKFDTAFEQVIRACADARSDKRKDTWINDEIIALYSDLAQKGFAHSVECWHEGKLVGGLYGIALGKAFFGESMFSLKENASKVALVHLVNYLKAHNFVLLDTQFTNEHLLQFGVISISKADYMQRLKMALENVTR